MTTAILATATINQTLSGNYAEQRTSPFATFFAWCTAQEKNRLLWTGIMLAVHGCVLTPITVLLVILTGLNTVLLTTSIFAMTFVLITNLAALPTKYTLPTFILSLVVDILVVAAAFSI